MFRVRTGTPRVLTTWDWSSPSVRAQRWQARTTGRWQIPRSSSMGTASQVSCPQLLFLLPELPKKCLKCRRDDRRDSHQRSCLRHVMPQCADQLPDPPDPAPTLDRHLRHFAATFGGLASSWGSLLCGDGARSPTTTCRKRTTRPCRWMPCPDAAASGRAHRGSGHVARFARATRRQPNAFTSTRSTSSPTTRPGRAGPVVALHSGCNRSRVLVWHVRREASRVCAPADLTAAWVRVSIGAGSGRPGTGP